MTLELSGKLISVLPEQTGTGQKGPWVKQNFVIETADQYPKKICFIAWNDKTEILGQLKPGEEIKVSFNLESREYNGRWYTDASAWRITRASEGSASPPEFVPDREPLYNEGKREPDDLPF